LRIANRFRNQDRNGGGRTDMRTREYLDAALAADPAARIIVLGDLD
jgi:hypothetical protein